MPKQIAPQDWRADFAESTLFMGYGHTAAHFAQHTTWPTAEHLSAHARGVQNSIYNAAHLPLCFDPQNQPCGQLDYEAQIYLTGHVPTRPANWHDLLNALVWLTFPRLKAALNAVQYAALTQQNPERGARSDAATVFDESGAVLIGPDAELADLLRAHDWHAAFVERRALWQTNRLFVIGHAVLEKTLTPYPGMIAKVISLPWPALSGPLETPPEGLDAALARHWLGDAIHRPADLFALPVLGVPGADPANSAPSYYDNAAVFRVKREETN